MSKFSFKILKQSSRSRARLGIIETPHGIVETPGFVPVATNASLKSIDICTADELGCQLMFCNTYHLVLQPGTDIVEKMGGLHRFMNRKGALITDSGGFQIFSMLAGQLELEKNVGLKGAGDKKRPSRVMKVSRRDGVTFQSYRDGRKVTLSPESTVQAQKKLAADIIIPLDHLPPYSATRLDVEDSLEMTNHWEDRSLREHLDDPRDQAMYGVVHGALEKDLRARSMDFISSRPFDGIAVGGSFGKDGHDLKQLLEFLAPLYPQDKPRHLLGIGDIPNIHQGILNGLDTFDSAYPTQIARRGAALQGADKKYINLVNARFKTSDAPLSPDCECSTCKNYTCSYIHHLFKASEPMAAVLVTHHNIYQMQQVMKVFRQRILDDQI